MFAIAKYKGGKTDFSSREAPTQPVSDAKKRKKRNNGRFVGMLFDLSLCATLIKFLLGICVMAAQQSSAVLILCLQTPPNTA